MNKHDSTTRLRRCGGAFALLLTIGTLAAACSSGAPQTAAAPPVPTSVVATPSAPSTSEVSTTAAPEAVGAVVVKTADSTLGKILVDPNGLTLYGFTNDRATGASTCFGACAKAWPPLLVGINDTASPEINAGIVSTIIRTDGQRQFVVGTYPVYTYVGDTSPGDLSGSGLGGVWFPIAPDGSLITDGVAVASSTGFPGDSTATGATEGSGTAATETAATETSRATTGYGEGSVEPTPTAEVAPPVLTGSTDLGDVLTDANGLTLYGFLDDTPEKVACVDNCAKAWPPLTLADSTLPTGLDPALYSVGSRTDGTFQLKAGKWWLYTFAGDSAAGQTNGQGSAEKWFAVAPDGKLIKG